MVDRRVNGFQFFLAILHFAISRNVLHRAGTIERHKGHDIFDTGRFHPLERVHHTAGFHLEHGNGLGGGIKLIGFFIVQRDQTDVVFCPLCRFIKNGAVSGLMQRAP